MRREKKWKHHHNISFCVYIFSARYKLINVIEYIRKRFECVRNYVFIEIFGVTWHSVLIIALSFEKKRT